VDAPAIGLPGAPNTSGGRCSITSFHHRTHGLTPGCSCYCSWCVGTSPWHSGGTGVEKGRSWWHPSARVRYVLLLPQGGACYPHTSSVDLPCGSVHPCMELLRVLGLVCRLYVHSLCPSPADALLLSCGVARRAGWTDLQRK
jgi:hypothetical protein